MGGPTLLSQFFSEQALDPEFTLAFCFSERGPKELRGRSAMYLGALSDEQAAARGPVVKAERPWQRPSGAACANGAVDMEHGRRELKMLDGAAPCRRPFIGLWPTAHPYVLNFGKIGETNSGLRICLKRVI